MSAFGLPWLSHGGVGGPATLIVSGVSASVAEVTNVTVGVVLAVVGLAGLGAGLLRSNRERRREMEQARRDYEHEIEAAERRGEERYRSEFEFWRGVAVTQLNAAGHPIPTPPSKREGE